MSELEDQVTETLREYQEARQQADKVRSQHIASGPLLPGEKLQWPPKVLDITGHKEIESADKNEREKWDAHQAAIEAWRRSGT